MNSQKPFKKTGKFGGKFNKKSNFKKENTEFFSTSPEPQGYSPKFKNKKRGQQAPLDTSWNKSAKWYDKLVGDAGSEFHTHLIIPGVLKLLFPQKNEKILDLACGQGFFSVKLAKLGARVTGADMSPRLITMARERSHGLPIEYVICDAQDLAGVPSNQFTAVVCILALQNIESFEKVMQALNIVTQKKARFVFVLNHPHFRIPRHSGWKTDENRKTQLRWVDAYKNDMKIPIQMHPGADPDISTWSFHRPLESYVKSLAQNGWVVDAIEEWVSHKESHPGKTANMENRSRNEIPLFMAVRAYRV